MLNKTLTHTKASRKFSWKPVFFFPTVVNYRQNVAGEASKEYYFEFPAKAKQQQEQAVK